MIIWSLADAAQDDATAPAGVRVHKVRNAHASEVLRCSWSPSGRLLATGGADGSASVYEVPDDAPPVQRLRLALRADGAAAAGATTGAPAAAGEGVGDDAQVYGIEFGGSDGTLLVAAGSTVRHFDLAAGGVCTVDISLGGGGGFVFGGVRNTTSEAFAFDLARSGDGALLALACSDGRVHVLDARLRADCAGLVLNVAADDYVAACAFADGGGDDDDRDGASDSALLATACGGGGVLLWDVRSPRSPLARCVPHAGTAYGCAAFGAGLVATVGRDKRLAVHDMRALASTAGAGANDEVEEASARYAFRLSDYGLCCAGHGRLVAAAGGSGGFVTDTAIHVWRLT